MMMANSRQSNLSASFNDAYVGSYYGDSTLLMITALLMVIGLVMMTSASIEISESGYGDAFYYLKKQLVFIFIGVVAASVVVAIPLKYWKKNAVIIFIGAISILAIVLLPGVGLNVKGSTRWLNLGFTTVQASEPAKLMIVIFMAWFLSKYRNLVCNNWKGFALPFVFLALPILLLLKEPDFGAVVVLMIAVFGMMFLAGVRLYQLGLVMLSAIGGGWILIVTSVYRMKRVDSYLQALIDPFNEEIVYGTGYQLAQALIGFGRGEWFGVGLGNSIQKLYFLPEAHTDFVLAIIAEELGVVSVIALLVLFLMFILRAIYIARKNEETNNYFAAYLGYGIAFIFLGQIVINMGVNVGLLPNKGLTLPFLSAGGSSLITCMVMLAFVLRIDIENFHATRKPLRAKY